MYNTTLIETINVYESLKLKYRPLQNNALEK